VTRRNQGIERPAQIALADAWASDTDNMKPGAGLPRFSWQPLKEARGEI